MGEKLPVGRLARAVRDVIAAAEELEPFAAALDRYREVDPASASVASGMGSLTARLERAVRDAQTARALAAFYVREGRR
jgi:hypothetical protein